MPEEFGGRRPTPEEIERLKRLHQQRHGQCGRQHHRGRPPTVEDIRKRRLQLLVVITDRAKLKAVTEVLQQWRVHYHFSFFAQGTASSEILDLLGIGAVEKAVTLCITPRPLMPYLLGELEDRLGLARPGRGIAFTVPLSGVSSPVHQLLDQDFERRLETEMEKEVEKMSTGAGHDLILAVINQGCSEDVMAAARTQGATGGTVVHARRISGESAAKFFGIAIQEEKEIVAILTAREHKKEIMQAIGRSCGMRSEAKGIVVALPVDDIIGLGSALEETR